MENKNLWQLKRFHFALWTPISLSIIIALVIWYNGNYIWDFTAESFNYSLHIYKFPLGVLALVFPTVALIAALHRSDQTKKQIHEVEQKNRTDMYLAHYKYFFEHIEQAEKRINSWFEPDINQPIFEKASTISINKFKLYKELYPDNSLTDGISDPVFKLPIQLLSLLNSISEEVTELHKIISIDLNPSDEVEFCCPKEFQKAIGKILVSLDELDKLVFNRNQIQGLFGKVESKRNLRLKNQNYFPKYILFSNSKQLLTLIKLYADIYNSIIEAIEFRNANFDISLVSETLEYKENRENFITFRNWISSLMKDVENH